MEPDFHALYFPRHQKEIATWLLTKATNLASCRKCYDLIKGRFMKLCWCSSTERNYIKVRFQIKASVPWGKLQMACRGGVYKSVSTFSCLPFHKGCHGISECLIWQFYSWCPSWHNHKGKFLSPVGNKPVTFYLSSKCITCHTLGLIVKVGRKTRGKTRIWTTTAALAFQHLSKVPFSHVAHVVLTYKTLDLVKQANMMTIKDYFIQFYSNLFFSILVYVVGSIFWSCK